MTSEPEEDGNDYTFTKCVSSCDLSWFPEVWLHASILKYDRRQHSHLFIMCFNIHSSAWNQILYLTSNPQMWAYIFYSKSTSGCEGFQKGSCFELFKSLTYYQSKVQRFCISACKHTNLNAYQILYNWHALVMTVEFHGEKKENNHVPGWKIQKRRHNVLTNQSLHQK